MEIYSPIVRSTKGKDWKEEHKDEQPYFQTPLYLLRKDVLFL